MRNRLTTENSEAQEVGRGDVNPDLELDLRSAEAAGLVVPPPRTDLFAHSASFCGEKFWGFGAYGIRRAQRSTPYLGEMPTDDTEGGGLPTKGTK